MEDVKTIMSEFVGNVKKEVDKARRDGAVKRIEFNQDYFKWKVDKFEYSMDSGLASGASGQFATKKRIVYAHNLDSIISASPEFNSTAVLLDKTCQTQNSRLKLQSFLRFVIQCLLENNEVKQELIDLFMDELDDKPIKTKAIVMLQGVTVEEQPIKLSSYCVLRRITQADIEEEIPVHMPFFNVNDPIQNQVTAILEIEKEVSDGSEMQKEVEKSILILRLFRVGGVTSASYTLSGKKITSFIGGTFSSMQNLIIQREKLKVYTKDADKIKLFWKEFNALNQGSPMGVFQSSGLENVQFAYQRYCDSLFSAGVFEQQIASAIMGLESLYLNNSEELSRFLRLRISKFFCLAGLDPQHIQDVLKDAYGVRSYFVHGNKMDYKKRSKLQKKYVTENNFLKEVLEYLRLSIIILLSMHRQKDELIDFIDDSFIDKKRESELEIQLKSIMNRFGLEITGQNETKNQIKTN